MVSWVVWEGVGYIYPNGAKVESIPLNSSRASHSRSFMNVQSCMPD